MQEFLQTTALIFFNLFCISACLLVWYIFIFIRKIQEKAQETTYFIQENINNNSWMFKSIGIIFSTILPIFTKQNKSNKFKKFLDFFTR